MESEVSNSTGASRWSRIAILAVTTVIVVSSVGLFLFARDAYSADEIHRLIERSYNAQRPGGGRLFRAGYSPAVAIPAAAQNDLGKAQLLLLRYPNSERKQRLQGLVYLACGNWGNYVEVAQRFPAGMR